jgi:hypothetical protein
MDITTKALRKKEEQFFTKYGVSIRHFNNCKTITDKNKIRYNIEKYIENEPFATPFFFSHVLIYVINNNYIELQKKITSIMSKDSMDKTLNILARSEKLSTLKKFIKEHKLDLKTNKKILFEAVEGQKEVWDFLISKNINVSNNDNLAIIRTIHYRDQKKILSLFNHKKFDININTKNIFYASCRAGNLPMLVNIIEQTKIIPEMDKNKALYLAVENGCLNVVKFLLEFKNVKKKTYLYRNRILQMAFKNIKKQSFHSKQHNSIIELLLKEGNLNYNNIKQENIKNLTYLNNINKEIINEIFINNKLKAF